MVSGELHLQWSVVSSIYNCYWWVPLTTVSGEFHLQGVSGEFHLQLLVVSSTYKG